MIELERVHNYLQYLKIVLVTNFLISYYSKSSTALQPTLYQKFWWNLFPLCA